MPRITHLEINAQSPEALGEFYQNAFGWMVHKKQTGSEDYWFLLSGGMSEPNAINAGMKKRMQQGVQWVPTIHVDNIDTSLEKITACGGKITHPKRAVTSTGYLAYCEDPEGNLFGVLEKDANVS